MVNFAIMAFNKLLGLLGDAALRGRLLYCEFSVWKCIEDRVEGAGYLDEKFINNDDIVVGVLRERAHERTGYRRAFLVTKCEWWCVCMSCACMCAHARCV